MWIYLIEKQWGPKYATKANLIGNNETNDQGKPFYHVVSILGAPCMFLKINMFLVKSLI